MKRISLIKKGAAIAATALTALALTACGNASTQDAGFTGSSDAAYKIGVLQLTEHTALDAANKGFVKALDDSGINYTIDQQNAQNGPVCVPDHRQQAGGRWRRFDLRHRDPRRAGGR